MRRILAIALAAATLSPAVAVSQVPPPTTSYPAGWSQVGDGVSLSASGVSGNVLLGWVGAGPAPMLVNVCNTGGVGAYLALGRTNAVAATVGDAPVDAGRCTALSLNGAQYLAAITDGGSTTLGAWSGNGVPPNGVSASSAVPIGDPCQTAQKGYVAISQTGNTLLINASVGKKTYICSLLVVGADAENLSLVEGTGATCGTSTAAVIGGASAANGPNLAANGGFSHGMGMSAIAASPNGATDICLFQSGSGRVAGAVTYVQR